MKNLVLILALTTAALLPTLLNTFVSDDRVTIESTTDPHYHHPTRALTHWTYRFDFLVGGFNSWFWHATSLAIHLMNIVLVYLVLLKIIPIGAMWGTAVFAVHPLFAEGVQYVTARASVLAATFTWAALAAMLWLKGWARVAVVLTAAALAMMSKEEGFLVLPVLVVAWVVLNGRGKWFIALITIAAVALLYATSGTAPTYSPIIAGAVADMTASGMARIQPLNEYLSGTFQSFAWHLLPNIVLPIGLTADPAVNYSPVAAGLAVLVVIILAWVVFYSKLDKSWRLGIALILVTPPLARMVFLAPDSPFEHRAYMCGLGVAIIAGKLLSKMNGRVAVAIVAVLMIVTVGRDRVWANDVVLNEDAAVKNPTPRVWNNLGTAYLYAGRRDDAMHAWKKSNTPFANVNIAAMLIEQGHLSEAAVRLRSAADAASQLPAIWNNYSVLMLRLGNYPAAEAYAQRALAIDPYFGDAVRNLQLSHHLIPANVGYVETQ